MVSLGESVRNPAIHHLLFVLKVRDPKKKSPLNRRDNQNLHPPTRITRRQRGWTKKSRTQTPARTSTSVGKWKGLTTWGKPEKWWKPGQANLVGLSARPAGRLVGLTAGLMNWKVISKVLRLFLHQPLIHFDYWFLLNVESFFSPARLWPARPFLSGCLIGFVCARRKRAVSCQS